MWTNQAMQKRARIHHAFTLIEALVVVAIITLLLVILLPALKMARESARISVCQSQLNQIGIAMVNYAVDNASYFPDPFQATSVGYFIVWNYQSDFRPYINPYIGDNYDIMYCPSGGFMYGNGDVIRSPTDKFGNMGGWAVTNANSVENGNFSYGVMPSCNILLGASAYSPMWLDGHKDINRLSSVTDPSYELIAQDATWSDHGDNLPTQMNHPFPISKYYNENMPDRGTGLNNAYYDLSVRWKNREDARIRRKQYPGAWPEGYQMIWFY